MNEVVVMHNKPPRWNDALGAYCLNFNGRVTEASVKNFQLIADDAPEHIILQFGKVGIAAGATARSAPVWGLWGRILMRSVVVSQLNEGADA